MVNAKGVLPVGDGQIDGWFSYSDRREQDYQDMSLDMLGRLGYESDKHLFDYALAILLADIGNKPRRHRRSGIERGGGQGLSGGYASADDAYYDASGLRKDTVAALGYKSPVGDKANVAIKGYYHHNEGMGLWGHALCPQPQRHADLDPHHRIRHRPLGVFGSADFELAFNKITLGGWYEHNDFNQARRFYDLKSRSDPGRSFRDYPKDPFFTQWEFDFTTKTLQYYVQDNIDLGPVKVNLGWKGFKVTNEADAIIKDVFPEGRFETEDWFQPHAGIVYSLDDHAEVFAGFTQATRAFPSVNGSIWGHHPGGLRRDQGHDQARDLGHLRARRALQHVQLQRRARRLSGQLPEPPARRGERPRHHRQAPRCCRTSARCARSASMAAGDLKLSRAVSLYASYTYTDATYRDMSSTARGRSPRSRARP